MINRLREEIEQMDVNLVRYNVKTDSTEFIKKIKAYNEDSDTNTKEPKEKKRNMRTNCCSKVLVFPFCLDYSNLLFI